MHFYFATQVCKGDAKKVYYGGLQACEHSYDNSLQA